MKDDGLILSLPLFLGGPLRELKEEEDSYSISSFFHFRKSVLPPSPLDLSAIAAAGGREGGIVFQSPEEIAKRKKKKKFWRQLALLTEGRRKRH